MSQDVFSIVPIEVIQDPRLTKRQIKVLIALLSFRGKNTNTVWPSREKLSQRCNLPVTRISQTTSELVDLGWLTKDGKGGFSKSTRYQITVPNLVTVTKSVTVTKTVTPTVTKTVTGMGVTKTVTGKELTKNITNRTKRGGKRFNPPTIDEVSNYCFERNNRIDAESFINFYQSKGWMIGKNKMKCWQSAIRNWESRQNQKNKSSHVHAATLAAQGIDIDTGQSFGTGLEQIEGLLN
jgi:predicted transcriptional regulator